MSPADLYGVIGHPVAHSRSPRIHGLFAEQTGQRIRYEAIDAPPGAFARIAGEFRQRGGLGLNVTLPYKEDACRLATRLTDRARQAGAVNTLAWKDAEVLGDNTDGIGLVRDLEDNLGFAITGSRILLAGAGGAALGAVGPLLAHGAARVVIANRTAERATALVARFGSPARLEASPYGELTGPFDLIVNATAASLAGQVPPIPARAAGPGTYCYDMMYAAEPTPFLRWAEARGAGGSADGLGMLVEQAAESFALWRGVRPDTGPVSM